MPAGAIERRWTHDRVLEAMRAWQARYGRLSSSYDRRVRTRGAVAVSARQLSATDGHSAILGA